MPVNPSNLKDNGAIIESQLIFGRKEMFHFMHFISPVFICLPKTLSGWNIEEALKMFSFII